MPVNAQWVTINGHQLLSITLPGHQYVQIDAAAGWQLLLHLRAAMRARPRPQPDNGTEEH